jgi:hypothetical protein
VGHRAASAGLINRIGSGGVDQAPCRVRILGRGYPWIFAPIARVAYSFWPRMVTPTKVNLQRRFFRPIPSARFSDLEEDEASY